jgi:hypothetical protein
MKNYSTPVFLMLFTLLAFAAGAQEKKIPLNEPDYNRPVLFQQLPATLDVEMNALRSTLTASRGQHILLDLTTDASLRLEGEVVSTDDKTDERVNSVVIRLTNFPGARLTFTKAVYPDGQVVYSGRIISFQHGDAYELKEQNGKFIFVKKNFYDLVNE